MSAYQPKTGMPCACRPGVQRDNCPACEGTGWQIDFAAIRARGKLPDLSDRGPYATKEDSETARELGITVRQLRQQRANEDTP